jgi:hypothetical protein
MASPQTLEEKTQDEFMSKAEMRQLFSRLFNEVLPKILEIEKKCDFLISHYGLSPTQQKYMKVVSDDTFIRQGKSVCEFYGVPVSTLEKPDFWKDTKFAKQEHIDSLVAYFESKKIPYDLSLFILKPFPV